MRHIYRYFFRPILYMIFILIGMLLVFYLMAPIYEFEEAKPFHGDKLYNPYEGMDSTQWKQYNFQVQSKVWGGVTSGRRNSSELIDSIYRDLNFDYVATSDYQKINYYGSDKPSFIPTYEHGYNIFKTHQICIGANQVLWVDLILFQTKSMKQWIIDQLQNDCEIVAIAHPKLRWGYSIRQMKYLTNYQIMEVLNNIRSSVLHWDAALSSGHLTWIMANDDAHDVQNQNHVGRKFTMINSNTTNRNDILNSLKSGNAYGVDFFPISDVALSERIARIKKIPVIRQVDLKGDTLHVRSDKRATKIEFIGQNGILKKTVSNTKDAFYVIKPEDSYVRTVFKFGVPDALKWGDGTTIFLNPIVRYHGDQPESTRTARVNQTATLWLRISYFLIVLTIIYLIRRKKLNKA